MDGKCLFCGPVYLRGCHQTREIGADLDQSLEFPVLLGPDDYPNVFFLIRDPIDPGRTVLQSVPVAVPVDSAGIPLDTILRGHQRRCLHPHGGSLNSLIA